MFKLRIYKIEDSAGLVEIKDIIEVPKYRAKFILMESFDGIAMIIGKDLSKKDYYHSDILEEVKNEGLGSIAGGGYIKYENNIFVIYDQSVDYGPVKLPNACFFAQFLGGKLGYPYMIEPFG